MDMFTGKTITDIEYLRQSVYRVLSTPIGDRIMRPEFGSRLPDLVDYPFNNSTKLSMEAATSDALSRWEPTLDVEEVEIEMNAPGVVLIHLIGVFRKQRISLTDIEITNQPQSPGTAILDGGGNEIQDGLRNPLRA